MAYKKKQDLSTDKTIKLGGIDEASQKPNPTSIEGYFLGTKTTPDTGYGPGQLHFFQTEEGVVGVWGKTNLNRLLTPDLAGQMVLVNFKGMGPKVKGKNRAYLYEVQHDSDNTTEVSSFSSAEEPSSESVGSSEDEEYSYEAEDVVEAAPARPVAPAKAAVTPSADRQARVQALLNKGRAQR